MQDHLSLLNLVNFGGGCYTVYAEYDDGTGRVRVDKELYGDVFRRAAEADAARGTCDPAGDRVRRPDDRCGLPQALARVRKKLEETFGQFELAQTPAPRVPTTRRSS